jgi:ligand-binding SRPBCC domain-containing protein
MQELNTPLPIPNDVEHMRQFYPDGATKLIIDQIKGYLET